MLSDGDHRDLDLVQKINMHRGSRSGLATSQSPNKTLLSNAEMKDLYNRRREKNEANLRLSEFKKSFASNLHAGAQIPTL